MALLRHRLLHPAATVKALLGRWLSYPMRAALVRMMRRMRPRPEPGRGTGAEVDFRGWQDAVTEGRPRPVIIFLPVIEWSLRVQRPHHLCAGLAARGWPVLYGGLETPARDASIAVRPHEVAPGVRLFDFRGLGLQPVSGRSLDDPVVRSLVAAFDEMRRAERIHEAVILCQSPSWRPLAAALRERFGWRVVYDRIDLHSGFSSADRGIAEDDEQLVAQADLVTATSQVLAKVGGASSRRVVPLPNAASPEHWFGAAAAEELEEIPHPIIGYFGAISDWFDLELLEAVAIARSDWHFVLVGSTWGIDTARLEILSNVHLLGERSYAELPSLAAGFDVGIIPFQRTPLTDATDPVKLYEMLAAGLEVVATRLPELMHRGETVRLASDPNEFVAAIEQALTEASRRDARQQMLPLQESWSNRVETLERELVELFPQVTIGIVTFNNLELTELCLASIGSRTIYPNYEVVVVDNASSDGTADWLRDEVAARPRHRVVLNSDNRGFGPACNQALANSEAEFVCLLNNDTVVTGGWLSTLVGALGESDEVGLVGPSTNGAANEARVEPGYAELVGLEEWASAYVWDHEGESFTIPMLALFCVVMRRSLWTDLDGLDEQFEVGLFEDDDFSRRVRRAGYDVRCRRDAWVHHFHEASFGRLPDEEYQRIYEANRRRFRAKWRMR
ncbi:MAG: glycosyltransferase [Holophagae bacterium]|jgi:GT2 family glycosyltransferase/glycosyltransferase involved in cell wall biosynthesis